MTLRTLNGARTVARRTSSLALGALLTGTLVTLAAPAAQAAAVNNCWNKDNGDPVLTGFSRAPASVDVRHGAKKVNFTVKAHDTGGPGAASGISSVSVFAYSSAGFKSVFATLRKNAAGDYAGAATIPRWTSNGQWQISSVSLSDRAGNYKTYYQTDLSDAGFPTTFSVTSTPDTTAPRLTGFTFSPGSVNTTKAAKSVTFTAKVTDSQSGVNGVYVSAEGKAPNARGFAFLSHVSGPTYRGKMLIGTWVRTSAWHITNVSFSDKIGNFAALSYAQLGARHFKRNLAVKSGIDTGKPTMASFGRAPAKVDVRTKNKQVAVTVRAKDAKSGVASVYVSFVGKTFSTGGFLSRKSGSSHNGVWKGSVLVAKCSASSGRLKGTVTITDLAGNTRDFKVTVLTVRAGDHRVPQATTPSSIATSDPVVVTFNESVNGIDTNSATLRKVGFPNDGPKIAGAWACKTAAGANTNCKTGSVKKATFTPNAALESFTSYNVELNPEHSLGVTDLAGNPFRRYTTGVFTSS
ncbi:MAG TPA: Ig-like domain-containing protein [Nocardioidaceae bacterium]